ncbi:MAG: hypothetical protein Q7R81_03290 [Candidatus Peregrinibacteria bacterium]|nr:hypothetical protein [Candidatus Peregrinibacteria bacterium]
MLYRITPFAKEEEDREEELERTTGYPGGIHDGVQDDELALATAE